MFLLDILSHRMSEMAISHSSRIITDERALFATSQSNDLSGWVASGVYCLPGAGAINCCMRLRLSGKPHCSTIFPATTL